MRLFRGTPGKCIRTKAGYPLFFCALKKMRRKTTTGLFSLILLLLHITSVGSQLDIESYRSVLGDVFMDQFYLHQIFPDVDMCSHLPCFNNAQCASSKFVFDYECICQDGYAGIHCENVTDACCSQPCLNNADCIPIEIPRGYTCRCQEHYTGHDCEAVIQEGRCRETSCLHNGTCIDIEQSSTHLCNCTDRYVGDSCEIDIDSCRDQPCLNNGACTNVSGTYKCICPDGLSGDKCERGVAKEENCAIRLDDKTVDVIKQGRKCSDLQKRADNVSYALVGLFNYFLGGNHAIYTRNITFRDRRAVNVDLHFEDLQVDEILDTLSSIRYVVRCRDKPCKNDALCIDEADGYICQCKIGFIGQTCDVYAEVFTYNPCLSNPCLNGATCHQLQLDMYNYICQCHLGFTGTNCKERVVTCTYSPCVNGGTCTDHVTGFACDCKEEFTGPTCETLISGQNATGEVRSPPSDNYAVSLTVISVLLAFALGLSLLGNALLVWERQKRKSTQVESGIRVS